MALIRVTSEELAAQGGRTRAAAGNVDQTLASLRTQINDLSGRWEGAASSNFQTLYAEWQAAATRVQVALDGIATFLNEAAMTYEEAEQAIAAAAAR